MKAVKNSQEPERLNPMHQPITKDQVENALEDFVKPPFGNVSWPVYKTYEIQEEDGAEYVVAPLTPESVMKPTGQRNGWQTYTLRNPREEALTLYAPLRTPELLLEFADLADKPITAEGIQRWAEIYGLLGLPEHDVVEAIGSWKGYARRDSVQDFREAAYVMRSALRAYELAIADEPIAGHKPGMYDHSMPSKAMPRWMPRWKGDQQWILAYVAGTVQMGLDEHCYPLITTYTDNGLPSGRFSLGYGFKNLLGAMWLQMARLLENGGESVKVCRLFECTRLIHFSTGERAPDEIKLEKHNARGKYKTRKNKAFCSGNCKSKYSYRKKAGWAGYY